MNVRLRLRTQSAMSSVARAVRANMPTVRITGYDASPEVRAIAERIENRLDVDTLTDGPADTLELNDIGTVALRLASPIPAEEYARIVADLPNHDVSRANALLRTFARLCMDGRFV